MGSSLDLTTLEIRYNRGIVYLDRCGALMLELEGALGTPFRTNVQIAAATLNSDAEHLAITYGPKSLVVTQRWTEAPVRVEQLGPLAWEKVSEVLNVGREVTRCGLRFQFVWPVDTIDEGHAEVRRLNLVAPTEPWRTLCGDPIRQAYAGVVRDHRGAEMRVNLDVIEQKTEGYLPPDIAERVYAYAIQLDVDNVRGNEDSKQTYALGTGQLREFMRESWTKSRRIADRVAELLGRRDDNN